MNRTQAMQILMLNSDASFDDVKYSYRKLSLELHPDRNKNESDGRRFKNVLDAYHFLKSQSRLKNSHYNDKTTMKKSRTYQNTVKQNPPEEDWSKFTKDFEMDENFWRHYEKSFWKDYELKKNEAKKNDYGRAFWNENEERIRPSVRLAPHVISTLYPEDVVVITSFLRATFGSSTKTISPSLRVISKFTFPLTLPGPPNIK